VWTEVALQVPPGTQGTVQRLAAHPGEVFALVANQYLLRSVGSRFDEVLVFTNPDLDTFQLSGSGAVAAISFRTLMSCTSNCGPGGTYVDFGLPAAPIALCGSADELGVMTKASDAGASLFAQTDAGWDPVTRLNVNGPMDCARTTRGDFFVAGQGAVGNANLTSVSLEVPDTSALGRASSSEVWTKMGTDGTWVIAASVRGAVARRPEDAGWRVDTALGGEIAALAVESPSEIWVVGTGLGLARFDGTRWSPAGQGPALLTSFDALALEGPHVYVGGSDASGVARVFRRLR
jgi:hypothetical protein